MKSAIPYLITAAAGAIALASSAISAMAADPAFGPGNPFYAPSTLPFHAPPFDKIHDSDYQPAIEAGMAEQIKEIRAIADNPDQPTFENTIVAESCERGLRRGDRREHQSRFAKSGRDRNA
jgi:peptidyl-dipeptidase Dcp